MLALELHQMQVLMEREMGRLIVLCEKNFLAQLQVQRQVKGQLA
jgi:hypothetical protein